MDQKLQFSEISGLICALNPVISAVTGREGKVYSPEMPWTRFRTIRIEKMIFLGSNMAKIPQNQPKIENNGSKIYGLLGSLHLHIQYQ